MDVVRTPDPRFADLSGYPFAPHYLDVSASDTPALRMHYVGGGPAAGPPVVLLHGEPTWSYLYRTMIPPLAAAGRRVLAPDLIGFGRSDKPSRVEDYTYLRAGYDAPYPDKTYQAGARAFPLLVPTSAKDPAIPANRAAWEVLGRWEKPFLAVFGAKDPILGKADKPLIEHVPGAKGQPHDRIRGSHFVQEDCGPELVDRMLSWEDALR